MPIQAMESREAFKSGLTSANQTILEHLHLLTNQKVQARRMFYILSYGLSHPRNKTSIIMERYIYMDIKYMTYI